MAGAWTTIAVKDGTGASITMRAWDESGAGSGPFSFGQMSSNGVGGGGEVALETGNLATLAGAVSGGKVLVTADTVGVSTGTAVITDANGTLQQYLRGLVKLIAAGISVTAGAVDQLWDAGTNGFITSPFNLLTTELNTLANGASVTSSVGGSSGKFAQSNYGSALQGYATFKFGGSYTPNVGDHLDVWFVRSVDNSVFETTFSNTDMARAPDAQFTFNNAAYSSGNTVLSNAPVTVFPGPHFVYAVSHMTAASLPSSGNVIQFAPCAVKA
jgi:hypothetical protein